MYEKPIRAFFPNEKVVGRMIYTPYAGDKEFIFPTKAAAVAYAAVHPHTHKVTRTAIQPNGKKKRVSWEAGLRHDAEISRFGGQSPYLEEAGSVMTPDYDVINTETIIESDAGIVHRLLK